MGIISHRTKPKKKSSLKRCFFYCLIDLKSKKAKIEKGIGSQDMDTTNLM